MKNVSDDKRVNKIRSRIKTIFLLILISLGCMAILLQQLKPMESITNKKDSINVKLYYFEGFIDTATATPPLNKKNLRRLNSFNNNKICVSVFRTVDVDETVIKNFLLSWLKSRYPNVSINKSSVKFIKEEWNNSHDACDDAYLSNVFQYDKRSDQLDITYDNLAFNWVVAGALFYMGFITFVMILWFVHIHKDDLRFLRDGQ